MASNIPPVAYSEDGPDTKLLWQAWSILSLAMSKQGRGENRVHLHLFDKSRKTPAIAIDYSNHTGLCESIFRMYDGQPQKRENRSQAQFDRHCRYLYTALKYTISPSNPFTTHHPVTATQNISTARTQTAQKDWHQFTLAPPAPPPPSVG